MQWYFLPREICGSRGDGYEDGWLSSGMLHCVVCHILTDVSEGLHVGQYLPDCTVQLPIRQPSSYFLPLISFDESTVTVDSFSNNSVKLFLGSQQKNFCYLLEQDTALHPTPKE
jgi:hypothetical protein